MKKHIWQKEIDKWWIEKRTDMGESLGTENIGEYDINELKQKISGSENEWIKDFEGFEDFLFKNSKFKLWGFY